MINIEQLNLWTGANTPLPKNFATFDLGNKVGIFDNYISIDLPFEPSLQARYELEKKFSLDLSTIEHDRGNEAHITVLSPVEYWKFHPYFKIEEIYELAQNENIQAYDFEVIGIGECNIVESQLKLRTFFFILKSPQLIEFRHKLMADKRAAQVTNFNPEVFYPHITIGYTHRDLHASDNVIKNLDRILKDFDFR